jgi:hypothetical protein
MTVIKQYNTGTAAWETILIGEKGETGDTGEQGEQGVQGLPGQGVPAGGAPGMTLFKVSAADYDTLWFAPESAGKPINNQTGTTYAFILTDTGKIVTFNNAATITVTVPTDVAANFLVGSVIELVQLGAGQVQLAASVGVTLGSPTGLGTKLRTQYSWGQLVKLAANTWVLSGDTAA